MKKFLNTLKNKLFTKKEVKHSKRFYKVIDFLNKYSYIFHALLSCLVVFIVELVSRRSFISAFGFIAKTNNKIVGFAFGYIFLKPDDRKVFYLDAIDIMPEYQGQGYGTSLISYARDYAKSIDCYKMYLITNKSNISACKCYEKAGGINKADDEVVYVYDFRKNNRKET